MGKRTHGQLLLDDFLEKLGASLKAMEEKNQVDLSELNPAWEARDKLEAYLSTPQRDNNGKFIATRESTKEPSNEL